MPRIASNPALDIEPDFTLATFEGIRNRIIGNTQLTHDEVANELATGWQQDRDIRMAAWTLQTNDEAWLAAEAAQAELELLEQERTLLEQEAEKERHETEKKKPKINDFQAGTSVGDTLAHRPSQYAIHKLKSFEYIELWYFSPDGCREAADKAKLAADGTFGFTKVDDFIVLKPVAAFKLVLPWFGPEPRFCILRGPNRNEVRGPLSLGRFGHRFGLSRTVPNREPELPCDIGEAHTYGHFDFWILEICTDFEFCLVPHGHFDFWDPRDLY
ncbi:hypothetical protein F4604DRAFT_1914589 [Suillus subluteus]|nr:hypothetical protein F4604DRAFT_1914589 [Suillus subluteus]